MKRNRAAFTIIELLVVVSIIALLVGILLPAVGKARDQAKLTMSQANLRNIGVASQSYASEFGGRQFTLINDSLASYGRSVQQAFEGYYQSNGGTEDYHTHPGPILGWGYLEGNPANPLVRFGYFTHESGSSTEGHTGSLSAPNASLNLPINFDSLNEWFGSFRLINVQQFHQYVSGKFYDKVFYAPKDNVPIETITGGGFNGANCFDDPGEYCDRPDISGQGEIPTWSSYCLSPAAMYNPQVMAHTDPVTGIGWKDPWELPGSFRSPSFDQALYPNLKTHVLEHHWLQNRSVDCNTNYNIGTYMGGTCEPYYFNQAWASSPVTLFYDGHVASVGTREAMRADGRVREQTRESTWGLWSNDTNWGNDGYLSDAGYDQANTSYHVLTTDGIRGRDISD